MLYLYFEDWSHYIFQLDEKGIEHGNKIIKAYTSPVDPRVKLNDANLKVAEMDDSALHSEIFGYQERGVFTGSDIENHITNLNEFAKRSVRALFRFANREDLQFCQTGMQMKKADGQWLIDHPIKDIDSIDFAEKFPTKRSATIHLDIFNKNSLVRLAHILDLSPTSKELVYWRNGMVLKNEIQLEINSFSKERK
jgi:hypothetical protein